MPRKKSTSTSPRPTSPPKSIRDLRRRKVKLAELIKIPVEQDGDSYILYSRPLSLGIARKFTQLGQMDENDPTRGLKGIEVADEFIRTHLRDEDGSEIPSDELASIVDSLDIDFATELAKSMFQYITGIEVDDEDEDGDDNEGRVKKALSSDGGASD